MRLLNRLVFWYVVLVGIPAHIYVAYLLLSR